MAYWLLKTEPDAYSWDDLVREGRTVWDGVANNLALLHIRKVKKGDRALIYHTGKVRAAVGTAKIVSGSYPDPTKADTRYVVFDIEPEKPLGRPVTLIEVKARTELEDFALVRMGRLSVVPMTRQQWDLMLEMGKKTKQP